DFFSQVRAGLDAAGVAYELAPHLVRGLDYYRHTAFEFVTDQLGAQGTILAGGRYDGLIEQLGGPHTPAVGWAAGIERLAMLIDSLEIQTLDVAVVVEHDRAMPSAWLATTMLRKAGLKTEMVSTGSSRKRYDRAVKKDPIAIVVLSVLDDKLSVRINTEGSLDAAEVIGAIKWPELAEA
ncbi:MAG: ATP phosphoribosyltransferase regulatory subunit, partial [Sphingomonas bacterium]|nr:ATP phosphoribosyltransferase regulatory subunit [Sphingomonas bacterium]